MNLPIIWSDNTKRSKDTTDTIIPTTSNDSIAKARNKPSQKPANDKESKKQINVNLAFDDLEWDFSNDVAMFSSYNTKPYSTNSTNSPACSNNDK